MVGDLLKETVDAAASVAFGLLVLVSLAMCAGALGGLAWRVGQWVAGL